MRSWHDVCRRRRTGVRSKNCRRSAGSSSGSYRGASSSGKCHSSEGSSNSRRSSGRYRARKTDAPFVSLLRGTKLCPLLLLFFFPFSEHSLLCACIGILQHDTISTYSVLVQESVRGVMTHGRQLFPRSNRRCCCPSPMVLPGVLATAPSAAGRRL